MDTERQRKLAVLADAAKRLVDKAEWIELFDGRLKFQVMTEGAWWDFKNAVEALDE